MIEVIFTYHVSFFYKTGCGSSTVNRKNRIRSANDVASLANFLAEQHKIENVAIITWKFVNFKIRLKK
jgi:hypothetical protein